MRHGFAFRGPDREQCSMANTDGNRTTKSTPFAAAVTPGRDKVSSQKSFRRYSEEQECPQ